MREKLSITIVAYHNYDDIQEAVRTIEQFTNSCISKRIYIVDNSEWVHKENEEAVNRFQTVLNGYTDIEYISVDKNIGFGKGHNLVLPKLESEYHAIVNPDILLNSDAFSAIINYMEHNPDVGMCIPKLINENGDCLHVYRKEVTILDMFIRMFCANWFTKRQAEHTLQNMDYSQPFQVPFGQGSFLVIKTELFKELNGFDDRFFMYMEDADLCKRVNQVSKLMYYPDASVIHKWERGSHRNKKLLKYHLQSMKKYFNKWGYKWM